MNESECRKLFSQNIKRYRSRLGLSQLNLALDLGISPNFLSDIETGKKWVSPNTIVQLANALKIEVYELFKPEEAITPDANVIISKCLDDVSTSIRQSVERSVKQSVEESLHNIREYYIHQ
jgi:transcriptional regulator with XRE-family HTH domain